MAGNKQKGYMKNYMSGFLRMAIALLFVLAQMALIVVMSIWLSHFAAAIYFVIQVVAVFLVVGLVNTSTNSSFKVTWLMTIALVPMAGLLMYVSWGHTNRTKRIKKRDGEYLDYMKRFTEDDTVAAEQFHKNMPDRYNQANYLRHEGFPLSEAYNPQFFDSGEASFEQVFKDLETAERFVFLDFFIVADGALWQKVKKSLLDCVGRGVEVRLLYDDFGAMIRTSKDFWIELEQLGIKTAKFNPIGKYLDKLYCNYRSHQKIIIIDGKIGYTGGFNLADEYINAIDRFGHWKDSGIRIEGPAVFGLTSIFLGMWGMAVKQNEPDVSRYIAVDFDKTDRKVPCQVISDGPLNNPDNPIASSIKQMIYNARDYLYITTPYLIIEDEIIEALVDAAKSGIDVRIVTPAVPDKKLTFQLTQYHYGRLLKGGVKIYEYTPGFIHEKTFLTSDYCILGTINFDYRSLYLHYECGVAVWDKQFADTVLADVDRIFAVSKSVSIEEWENRPRKTKLGQRILYLFSVLF